VYICIKWKKVVFSFSSIDNREVAKQRVTVKYQVFPIIAYSLLIQGVPTLSTLAREVRCCVLGRVESSTLWKNVLCEALTLFYKFMLPVDHYFGTMTDYGIVGNRIRGDGRRDAGVVRAEQYNLFTARPGNVACCFCCYGVGSMCLINRAATTIKQEIMLQAAKGSTSKLLDSVLLTIHYTN
jgi:hypothetical protein